MKSLLRISAPAVLCLLVGVCGGPQAPALADPGTPAPVPRPQAVRDGQHDFDFSFGNWKSHIKRLDHPLTGSSTWVVWNASLTERKIWDGRANLEEMEADGPKSHLQGMTLRLYNPESHQWALSWANGGDGTLGQPAIGEFRDGRGEFMDQESFGGRAILVRQIYSEITPDAFHFEQAFSGDGGKTWEPNWIATVTRDAGRP